MMNLIPWQRRSLHQNGSSRLPMAPFPWNVDRLFDQVVNDLWPTDTHALAGVRIELAETDDAILVRAEVAGIDPKDLDISLQGDVLWLSGERKQEDLQEGQWSYSEHHYGKFQRAIQLSCPVEPDSVDAVHKNGILTVTLRKAEAVRPKRIEVKSA